MQENSKTLVYSNRAVWYIMTFLLLLTMGVFLFQVKDSYQISLLLLIGGLVGIRALPFKQWTFIDICIGILTLFDVMSCLYANCPLLSIRASLYSLYTLVAYLAYRRLLVWQPAEHIFRLCSDVLMGIALVLAVLSFFVFRTSVLEVGFGDTYHFRFLFRPLGYITNVWSEILLLILGWACLMCRRYAVILIFLSFTAIFLSFSRGAYIASGIYLVGCLLLMPKADKFKIWLSALVSLVLVGICCPKEMWTTFTMNCTASQRQSTESRIYGTEAAWKAFEKSPIIGYGSGNYMYVLDPMIGQDSTKLLTSMPPNTLARLLIEKGIAGTLLYLVLLIAIIRSLWRRRKKRESSIVACTLIAFLIKDMTQSAWGEIPFLMLMVYLFLAYLQKEEEGEPKKISASASSYLIGGLIVAALLLWNIPCVRQAINPVGTYLRKKDYRKAFLKKTEDIQLRYLYASRTLMQENPIEADSILQKIATEFPKNSLYLTSYAGRCYMNGDKKMALKMISNAIRYTPRLLESELVKGWQSRDYDFYKNVITSAIREIPNKYASASDYACYGYILYYTGDTLNSITYLKEAVRLLPNLTIPYFLLGEYDKYKLLMYGAFQADLKKMCLPELPFVDEGYLIKKQLSLKIKNWYEVDLK